MERCNAQPVALLGQVLRCRSAPRLNSTVRAAYGAANGREMLRHCVVRAVAGANNSMERKELQNIADAPRSNISRTFRSSRGR